MEEQVGIIQHNPNYFGAASEDDLLNEKLFKDTDEDHRALNLDKEITEIKPHF